MRVATIAVVSSIVAWCAACGGSSPAKVTASITGGTKAERSLAQEILQKLAPSPVTSVRFRGLQHDAIHHWPGRRMDVSGTGDSNRSDWEESVFAYSYALLAQAHHIPIGYVSLDIGNGSLENALERAPRTPISDSRLDAYERKLGAAAKAANASISFRELRSGPVALEATVTTSKPAVLIEHHLAPFYDLWRSEPKGLYGFFLTIQRPTGAPALGEGLLPDAWMGSIDPRFERCTSFWSHSDSGPLRVATTARPCPV